MVNPATDSSPESDRSPERHAAGNETVIEGQKKALELALRGAPLPAVLEVLVQTVETQSASGVLGSILLLDEDGQRLLLGAAPSLPAEYNAAIDGIAVGPKVGSCGTAAFTGKTVVVSDVQVDPLWADFQALATEHRLRACWSTPIFSSKGAVLGTFALYHRVVATPTARDREIVDLLGRTAALVIERDSNARRAEASERELRTFIDNLPELAWTARPDGYIDSYNRRWYEYTGTTFEDMQGWGWERVHDPELLPEVIARWRHSLRTGEPFEMEFTIRGADGIARWFLTRIVPSRDSAGKILRWFGTNTNIDEIKSSLALSEAMADQSRETQRALLELRAAKERADARVAELEAERHLLSRSR